MGKYVTKYQLALIKADLSPVEMAVLSFLSHFRFATTDQIRRMYFAQGEYVTQARNCRRILRRLAVIRVVTRLDRRIGGKRAGSSGIVYALDVVGQRILRPDKPTRSSYEINPEFVKHVIAVTELAVSLHEAQREGHFDLITFDPEQASYRRFRGYGRKLLRPDAYTHITTASYEYKWFVEMDLASEHMPQIWGKLGAYVKYWRSGAEQARSGLFPAVLFLVPTAERRDKIRAQIEQLPVSARRPFRVELRPDAISVLTGGQACE